MPRGEDNVSQRTRVRHWVFTINNPTVRSVAGPLLARDLCGKEHVRYVVFQFEKGSQGTEHIQGYIEFDTSMRFSKVKDLLTQWGGVPHLEKRRGTRDQARDYCQKEESRLSGPFEAGEWATSQGKRTDLHDAADTLQTTRDLSEVARAHPVQWIRYYRGFESLFSRTMGRREAPPTVHLLYGTTGSGKTRWAYQGYPDLYRKAPDTKWFDGYEGQATVLLDDFVGAASKMSLSYLLQLLDRYDIRVEIKGSYVPLLATTIIITTNIHPRKWYDYSTREEQYKALARRVHRSYYFCDSFGGQVDHGAFWDDWAEYCDEERLFQTTRPNTPDC